MLEPQWRSRPAVFLVKAGFTELLPQDDPLGPHDYTDIRLTKASTEKLKALVSIMRAI
jgi:hypothetical protein